MPTLSPAARLDNIRISVNAYADSQIKTGLGVAVYYESQAAIGALPTQWAEVIFSQLSPLSVHMQTSPGRHGVIRDYLLDVNVYEKQDDISKVTLYSLTTTVENIRGLYLPRTAIPILDYTDIGTPVVGSLSVRSPPSVTRLSDPVIVGDSGLLQANISIPLESVEETID